MIFVVRAASAVFLRDTKNAAAVCCLHLQGTYTEKRVGTDSAVCCLYLKGAYTLTYPVVRVVTVCCLHLKGAYTLQNPGENMSGLYVAYICKVYTPHRYCLVSGQSCMLLTFAMHIHLISAKHFMILLYATYTCKVFTPWRSVSPHQQRCMLHTFARFLHPIVAKHLIILLYATYICRVLAPWFQRSCGQYSNATSGVVEPSR